ncbi:heme biosynthesis protein HemY [Roseococcus sp. SDR]|uniref:heme biosynthesis HemY N-terminal domain-containing protein n=1 Tax=Roseococcus sp. SDR TaxID=2835532 RepID=UPI001BCC40F6|nr:heme biosynthesis HemY N-terminal domain-containing protein [Roseococcus sp. SDR]MBS7790764.1 heme biosynthesis protein HemY [Roseococcus sp. SDR]MBV1846078.1 heme biosynthesis protein HemY [Roseococcus sp. SDR]
MRLVLKLLLVLLAGFAGVIWLMELGGSVEIRHGDLWIGAPLAAALILLALAFLLLHALLRLWSWLLAWPLRRRLRLERAHRAEGEQALTRALVALAAGRAEAARIEVTRARRLMGDSPQLLLLAAEASRAEGDEAAAAEAFQALAAQPEARFLGLRGLLRQAEARGDWDAAREIAAEAQAVEPEADWLRAERSEVARRRQDWSEALALSGADAPRAALSLAAALQERDPVRAAELERQAFLAEPGFAPGVIAHATRLLDAGQQRRARGVLQRGWNAAPHPGIAELVLSLDTDRIRRVRLVEELTRHTPTHPESRLLRARIAFEAGLTGRARHELTLWRETGQADQRCYALLGEVERAEHGPDAAREREAGWLREAAMAPVPPVWRCGHCGAEHSEWKPLCGACGTAGAITWSGAGK